MNYEAYRIFYYVALYRNITQASHALSMSQPNVTRCIKNLEASLGCQLLIRGNRGVECTLEGEKLFHHVSLAFSHFKQGEEEIQMAKNLKSGRISIGASEIPLHCCLLPILKQFRNQYPDIKICVSNYSTKQALKALKEGKVDFCVVTTPVKLEERMEMIPIKEIHETAICGNQYAYLCNQPLSLSEISTYPIICLGPTTMTYELYAQWFSEHGLLLNPDIEAATSDQIIPLVSHDLGIGFIAQELIHSSLKDIHCLTIKETIPSRKIVLVKDKTPLSLASKQLEKMILQS